jgi:hypothetical protein
MKQFTNTSDALKFAIEFNSKPIGERFAIVREYLDELPEYPYEAIDAAKRLAELDSKTIDEIKKEMIFTLGLSNSKKALTKLSVQLSEYQRTTNINMQDLQAKIEKLAFAIRNTTIDSNSDALSQNAE